MTPAGYMAKRVANRPDWIRRGEILDIYSVSSCISKAFADYIHFWKHNGYWFFNSPETMKRVAAENSIDLTGTALFYYEVYELEFNGEVWQSFEPEPSFETNVVVPSAKQLEGFDVVNYTARTSPECSPLACNNLAEILPANSHCLFASFDLAKQHVEAGDFNDAEPGPYRIHSVYSVGWD
jgi:hypothetical protein